MSLPTSITGVRIIPGEGVKIDTLPVPELTGAKVLVKLLAAPINPSDVGSLKGHYPAGKTPVCFAGLEGVGTAIATGPDADAALVGKRFCFFVSGSDQGSWADYAVVESKSLIPVPDAVDDEQAACALVNPLTVELFLLECAKQGHTAIVHGAAASALGIMLIQAAKKQEETTGAKVAIINLVRRAENVEFVKSKGAEYAIDLTLPDWEQQFAALSAELKPSAFFDPIGGSAGSKIVAMMPNHSTTYNYGALGDALSYTVSIPDLLFKGKVLRGIWLMTEMAKPGVAPVLIRNALGNLALKTYQTAIHKKFTYADFQQALDEYAANASKGKVLLVPSL